MGVYNPAAPHILGQEWVPIKKGLYVPDNFRELGYGFVTTGSRQVTEGRFYVNPETLEIPGNNYAFLINVYPQGQEVATGPIRVAHIPVMAGAVGAGATIIGGTVQNALATLEDGKSIAWTQNTFGSLQVNFNTTAYAGALNGKRILRMNLVGGAAVAPDSGNLTVNIINDPTGFSSVPGSISAAEMNDEFSISLGELTPFWTTSTTPYPNELHAWRYTTLARMASTGSPKITVQMTVTAGDFYAIDYLVLEVIYCEETRVAEGAKEMGNGAATLVPHVLGTTPVTLRDTSFGYPVTLPAGAYTVTLGLADYDGTAGLLS
jgi:hypothetical protein